MFPVFNYMSTLFHIEEKHLSRKQVYIISLLAEHKNRRYIFPLYYFIQNLHIQCMCMCIVYGRKTEKEKKTFVSFSFIIVSSVISLKKDMC